MTLEEFRKTVAAGAEPTVSLPLRALWWSARGEWKRAHDMIDEDETPDGMWVHAHLHRQEGNLSNARYWYDRVGKPEFAGSIADEWAEIAAALVARETGRR